MKIPCWKITPSPYGEHDHMIVPVGLAEDLRDLVDLVVQDLEWVAPGPAVEVLAVELDLVDVLRLNCEDRLFVDDPIMLRELVAFYEPDPEVLAAAIKAVREEL
jgi:hypothetical protein